MPLIEQVMQEFPEDGRHLRFIFGHGDKGYDALAMLALPSGNLVARTDAPVADHESAVDQVVNKLADEVRKHRASLRLPEPEGRKRRRERDFNAAEPHLRELHRSGDRDGLFDVLRPLLRQLRAHARRELIIAQLEGVISPGELDVGDLLDEVVLRAWDRWSDGPRDQPLDRWLVGLLHGVLDARGLPYMGSAKALPELPYERGRESVGVEHSPAGDDPTQENYSKAAHVVEDGWAVENNPYWPYVDSLTRDDVLPEDGSTDGVQLLTAEEQRRAILDELNRFSRDARRAFALHALEGWSLEELAESQDRPRAHVLADIDAVRRALRRRLPPTVA
jgi:DNA-directed RNA polymerase specialized sigma24 family protein